MLCFLNAIEFADKLDNDYLEEVLEVRKMLVREFEDYNNSKMIYALNNIDEGNLSDVTNDMDYRLESTDTLRSVNIFVISFKHLVDTDIKREDKQ